VFGAGEDPVVGATREDLVAGIVLQGHKDARALKNEDALESLVRTEARPGDIVVCLGAGTIGAWARELPARLSQDAA
ncbi:MAG: UDP-N-acetylmuramate--L-alanine ligase, partial [Boseongicola sp.]|nr:UDP-N-acetylmuramate--L-alanine ligase [Boseongicola sp.]